MVGIYRGLIVEAFGLARAAHAQVWVVEGGTRGPFAEASRMPGDTREAIAAQWGVAAAGAVAYQNVEAHHHGQSKRLLVVGAEIGRPGEAPRIVEGRPILRSRYEAIADRGPESNSVNRSSSVARPSRSSDAPKTLSAPAATRQSS